MKHPAEETQFDYFPLVMLYIKRASNKISFGEIQQNLIKKSYKLQAKAYDHPFEDGEIPQPPSRQGRGRYTDMYKRLSDILNELIYFGLVRVVDGRNNNSFLEKLPTQNPRGDITDDWICCLTPKGYDLLQFATLENYLEFKARYFNLMLDGFTIVPKLLQAIHNGGKDRVVLPHVTAQQLGLEALDLEKPDDLAFYLDKVTESVLDTYYNEVTQPEAWVDRKFRAQLQDWQVNILETSQQYHKKGQKYPRFLIIARVRDYCVSFFARVLTGDDTIKGRRLEALSSRLSKMEIMGYSDYIHKGRSLFLCSWVIPLLKTPPDRLDFPSNYKEFQLQALNPETPFQCLVMHQPEYALVKKSFEDSLTRTFEKLYFSQHKQFVSIPDLREYVCLDLKISTKTFDRLMLDAYNDSFNGESSLEITLASDPGYVEYGLERWHRIPLELEGRSMTVAKIKRRVS